MKKRIPVILCIDIEPDPQRPDPADPQPWRGFEQLYPFLRQLRHRIAATTGVPARMNWFWRMDPQVELVYKSAEWGARRYQAVVEEMILSGDEHGIHPHAWRRDESRKCWINDYGTASWIEHCVSTSCRAFESVFGKTCEMVRLGNRYFDDGVRATLERWGCLFDLTVEPGEGPEPELPQNYRTMPMGPYRPSLKDFKKPDSGRSAGLWMIPLAAGVMAERGLKWQRLLRKYVSSMGAIPTGYRALRLWEPPDLVQPAITETIRGMEHPYLAFAIRSDVLLNPWWGTNCRRNLEGLLTQEQAGRFVFCTPRDLLQVLELPVESTTHYR